jgi:hypothetical protein
MISVLGAVPIMRAVDKEATRVLVDLTSDIRSALTDGTPNCLCRIHELYFFLVRHHHRETDKVKAVIERLEPLVKTEATHFV